MAIFLALILGGIGAHKFYLNKPGWGFIYLIFCWTFIPAIIALMEAVIMLLTPESSFQERYAMQF
jgi:TM2 domain-containing membrane protein YozV